MNSRESFGSGDPPAARALRIGDFTADRVRRCLLDGEGRLVELPPRHFDALMYFADRSGELLDKEQLLAALWPGQVVEENNLNKLVSALRRVLGDNGHDKRYLITVPRRGFRFVAEVNAIVSDRPQGSGAGDAAPAQSAPPGASRRHVLLGVGLAAGGAAAVGAVWWGRQQRAAPRAGHARALAVLPFRPLLDQARDEVLELGMADSLITRLSAASGIAVRPIDAVRRHASGGRDPLAAARELDVDWVLDGTIGQSADRVRVTVRLIDATDGTAAWSGSFDEKLTGVFEVQDSISRKVAELVLPRLAQAAQPRLSASGTRDPQAYRLYLQARYHSQIFTPGSLARAEELFRQAIAADPGYAYAYAGLADVLRRKNFTSDASPRQNFPAVREAATRAVELDAEFGDAHAALGWVAYMHDWDWPAASRLFARARELAPSSVEAHYGGGHVLLTTGRIAEALPAFQRARELDPVSPLLRTLTGGVLVTLARVDEGQALMRSALSIDPAFWIAHQFLGRALLLSGRVDEGLSSLASAVEQSHGSIWATARWAQGMAEAGHTAAAKEALARMQEQSRARFVSPASMAAVHLALGDRREALQSLEAAYEARDTGLVYLELDHRWQPLHAEPRFVALAAKLGLQPGRSSRRTPF